MHVFPGTGRTAGESLKTTLNQNRSSVLSIAQLALLLCEIFAAPGFCIRAYSELSEIMKDRCGWDDRHILYLIAAKSLAQICKSDPFSSLPYGTSRNRISMMVP